MDQTGSTMIITLTSSNWESIDAQLWPYGTGSDVIITGPSPFIVDTEREEEQQNRSHARESHASQETIII